MTRSPPDAPARPFRVAAALRSADPSRMGIDTPDTPALDRAAWLVPMAFGLAGLFLVLVPALWGFGGPFIDELYYVACSDRPAWGYVDHPPLAPMLLRASRALLGDGMLALRLPPALAGAAVIVGVGLLAHRLGGGRRGQALACAGLLIAPLLQIMTGFFSMNAFEIAFWFALSWLFVEIELRGASRLWAAFGLVAGLALLNKHTVVLFAVGLGLGLLVTPARRHLVSRWLWLGVAIAAAFALPNLWWQHANGWPSLEFYRNASLHKQTSMPALAVVALQVIFVNPGGLPIWIAGLAFVLRRPRLRPLGVAYLALLAVMAAGHESRPDRISGMYPLLFAAGGVALERMLWSAGRALLGWTLVTWMTAWAALFAPLGLPILPPATTAHWTATLGVVPQMERGEGKRTELPQWFADRYGWEQLVDDVAGARARLAPEERGRVAYFAPSYGQAGALEWLGRDRGLTPVYSTHNTYYLWGPPPEPIDVAIVIGNTSERLGELFESVELATVHDCEFCMPWRDHMPIWIVRRERTPVASHWREWKHFE
jgi:Dolichyl-phosphate-mannose-protein mannosyltransferase